MGTGARPPEHGIGNPTFIGRDDELARLTRLLAQVAAGTPSTLVVRGEAGVGKSRLLREFAARALDSGAQVLSGSCIALGTGEFPYAPLIEALRRLVRDLGQDRVRELAGPAYADLASLASHAIDLDPPRADPPTPGTDAPGTDAPGADAPTPGRSAQSRVFGAVLRLLDGLGADRPVVFLVEDLQWADPSTMDLMAYLARTQTNERLLLVVSYRTTGLAPRHPLRTTIAELDLARRIQHLEVSRFGRTELKLFLRAATEADVPHDLVERAFELSEGNAFFVEELLAAGVLASNVRDDDAMALPGSVRDVVLARFELLDDDAREVMRVAATAGRRVSHLLLAAVSEMPDRRLLAALRECVDSQMLVTDPTDDTYVFRHALLREVVHRHLLPGERVQLHRAIATALAADSGLSYAQQLTVAAELSYHWHEAGAYPQALPAAVRAGDDAMRVLAFREAERQYDRALRVWQCLDSPQEIAAVPRLLLLLSAADAARWAGRIDRAVERVRAALSEVDSSRDPAPVGEVYERLGQYLWEAGDHSASDRAYAEAALLLADAPPSAVAARVLAVQAGAQVRDGRYAEGLRLGRQSLEMARAIGAADEEGRALNAVGIALTMLGEVEDGVATLSEAVRIADERHQLEGRYRAYGNLVFALESAGRLEEAVTIALKCLERARQDGLDHTRGGTVLATNVSVALVQLGRWDEAQKILDDLVQDRPVAESLYPRLTMAELAIARGDVDVADLLLAEVQRAGGTVRQSQFVGSMYACLAESAIWRHRYQDAKAAVTGGLRAIGDTDNHVALLRLYALGLRNEADEWLRRSALPNKARPDLAEISTAIEWLSAGVARLVAPTGGQPLPEVVALRLLCRAEQHRAGGVSGQRPGWAEVAERWEELGRPYQRAYAWWRCAESAAERRETADAQRAARLAYKLAAELRAEPLRREIVALAAGDRFDLAAEELDTPAVPPRPTGDPFGLTPRERQVLGLVCAGRTNRQIADELFITEKTASVHVSNILRKLDVPNRGRAAVVARKHRLLDDADSA